MTPCPACGRIFEPTTRLPSGGIAKGHVPGGDLCESRPRRVPAPTRPPAPSRVSTLPLEEREEIVRARLRASGWRSVGDR